MNVTSYIIDGVKTGGNNITDCIIEADTVHNTEIIDNSVHEVFGGLLTSTNESECIKGKGLCCSRNMVKLISKFINIPGDNKTVIEEAKKALSCDTESCVLVNDKFNKFIKEETGDNNIIKYELYKNFKTKGPRNSTDLLSNFNIDDTLIRWGDEFKDFYPCPFSMIDFKTVTNDFAVIDLADVASSRISYRDYINKYHYGPFKTFGCVLNTDVSTGYGKHWVCIFADFRSKVWTIEYFNSSGNPPNHDVSEWMEKQRSSLLKIHDNVETIAVTNIVHQKSNTECGMYVLYYIRSRLDGISYDYFLTKRIEDSNVTEFRKHVFRKY